MYKHYNNLHSEQTYVNRLEEVGSMVCLGIGSINTD